VPGGHEGGHHTQHWGAWDDKVDDDGERSPALPGEAEIRAGTLARVRVKSAASLARCTSQGYTNKRIHPPDSLYCCS
jgi:hypothetical protein